MVTNSRTTRKYAIYSLCFVMIFLMAPIATNPGDQFHSDTSSNLPYYDGMNLAADIMEFADSSTSDIDGSSDIGTHSSFPSQQAGPDSTYDTLVEGNGAPLPTNSEDDIDSDTSDVDSTPDVGVEGTFANAQGTTLDSSYFTLTEESVISPYGGETGGVFVTGSVPDTAGQDKNAQSCLYQAIFWNPTDDVYEISRVEFNGTGYTWLKSITQGSGSSFPISEWTLVSNQVAYWPAAPSTSSIAVQPHTAYSFYVKGLSNKLRTGFDIDIRITANSSTYTETYHSEQNRNFVAAQLWLGSSPAQNHSVTPETQTTVYVSLEEVSNKADIRSGGTLTIDVPTGFTGITNVGGTNWDTYSLNGNQITVKNNAAIRNTYRTYAFQITSPSTPGLYKLDIAFDDSNNAHPVGNFTIHVTGTPPAFEKVNVEYQWTSATIGEANEEVCINVGSHTGSENLEVSYWIGYDWIYLGSISNTGWTNFTATGLSSTYTIRLLGSSESADTSKDTWNINLITLHTWSIQTYNYKLDLEIQWSSANYTQDYEELCIYAGSLDTESIRVDVWAGSDWTNIATLTANSWKNISIGTWLTSATFTIRFRGDFEVGDTTQSSWEIDCSLLHTWDNEIPQNTAAPTISNIDDTSFLYAEYRQYEITANVSDGDGFAEIDYLELTLTSNDELTEYWTVRYDEDTDLFTEQSDPSNYITLDAGSSSAIESGNDISATFFITINWNHPDIVSTHVKSEVYDANPSSSLNYYEVNWDVETRLAMSSGATLSDGSGTLDRGDVDGSLTASGTITYFGSALHPSASDIDIWISSAEYGTQSGPWEATNYEHVGGTFSATVYADDLVGIDTYTFKAVSEGAGAGGSDHFGSSQTDDYIADRVQVQSYSTDDPRINVNSSANLHAVLYYEYNDDFVIDGTVTINGLTATYSGSDGIWNFNDTQSTAQLVTYDTLVYSGGAHEITVEDQNGQSVNQIWDYIKVVSYSVIDARVDVNSNAIIDVTLIFEYDGSSVTAGTVTINGVSATHQGAGVWRITVSNDTVQGVTYNLVVISDIAHDITLVDQNSQSQFVIWDRVIVTSYSITDNRVNIDDVVNLDVTLEYEYDNAPVVDGVVTINLESASHTVAGVWRISVSESTVQGVTYDTVVCSGNSFGISEVNPNSKSQLIIWDQITVRSYSISDDRVNIDDTVNIDVFLQYEYDDTNVTDGSVTINTISANYLVGGIWRLVESKATVQSFTYDSIVCSGNGYGISDVNQNGQSTSVIWDQVTVRSYTVLDNRVNIDDSVNIDVFLQYEYDDTNVTDGSVTINTISANYLVGGIWRLVESKATVQSFTYDSIVCSGNGYGISDVNQNGQSTSVIWDQVTVRSYTVLDNRVNIDDSVNISVLLEYEYDDTIVTVGSVIINTMSASYVSSGIWRITESKATVQSITYDVVTCSGNTFGISDVNQNSQSTEVIWDKVIVTSYSITDNRVNISDIVNLDVTLEYEHDSAPVVDGVVTINLVSASHTVGGVWTISVSESTVQGVTFNTVACSGNTFGITVVNQNSQSQLIIWDQITVRSYSVSDDRVNIGDSVNIDVFLQYEYDDTNVTDGSVIINGNPALWQADGVWRISQSRSSVQDVTFDTVACSSNNNGIINVNQNSQSQLVIWDQITVRGYEVSDARDNVGDTITVTVELEYEFDDSDVTDGSITINSVIFTYTGSLGKWSTSRMQGTVGDETFGTVTASGNTYEITDVFQNGQSQTIIWDRIQVLTTLVDDGRINTDSFCEIWVTLMLEYDSTLLGVGDTVTLDGVAMVWDGVDSRFELARLQSSVGEWLYFTNSSLESTYGISALDVNSQEISVIWDQIRILTTTVDDGRVGVDSSVELRVTAELAFDGHPLASGDTIVMDSTSMTWDASGWFDLSRTKATVGLWSFQVGSASETTYGITVVDLNGQSQDVIWDRLIINIVADLDSVENDIQVNFTMTVTFEYDLVVCTTYTLQIARNGTYWHTFTNSNASSFNDTNSDVSYRYNVTLVASETTYEITIFSTNIETVVWGGGTDAPVNAATPVLTNPDNSDYMFAKLRFYIITSNVSDAQGYSDIVYIELSLWDNSRSTEIWRLRYTESTNAFSIEVGSAYIQLSGSSYLKSGYDIDITWSIKIDWDHQDLSNIDIRQYVIDSSESDENWYEVDWDVETRLDYSIAPSLSDDRGDLDTNDLVCSGAVVYYGSVLHPLANETDVWFLHDVSGTWTSDVNGSGAFTISSITSSSSVRLNTYTIKVVINGDGSGGTDLYYTSSETTEFITDQIEFYLSGAEDGRINVNDTGVVWWNARYDYDNAEIIGGLTAQLNGSKVLVWDATNSRWYYQESSQSVTRIGYTLNSASESGFGLTGWVQSASNTSIIWDLVVVRSYSVTAARTNVSDTVNIDVLLEYTFDDSYVDDGTVQINSISASNQGSGIWRISESQSSVLSITYDTVSCLGNSFNITNVNQNSQFQEIIWDRIIVTSYDVDSDYVNVDDVVNVNVTLTFEYDSAAVVDGTVTINGVAAANLGLGVWRIVQTRDSIQSVTYNSVSCSGNTIGIAIVNQNSLFQDVIWDQIVVQSYTVSDHRVNVDLSVNIDFVLNYGYDNSPVLNGLVSINAINATYLGSGVWRIIDSKSSAQLVDYDTVVCSGNTHGITNVDQNGQSEAIIWDQIIVRSYSIEDSRIDVDTLIVINVTLEYAYDDSDVVNGLVLIQSVSATHVENGIWQISMIKSSVQSVKFDTVVCSGNVYEISSVNQNAQQLIVIWDQITVRGYEVSDPRDNVGDTIIVTVELEYEFDDSDVIDGTVTINSISFTYTGSLGKWSASRMQSSVTSETYDTVSISGNTHGITDINQNGQSQVIIWDRIQVLTTSVDDGRIDIDTPCEIRVTLMLEYDSTPLGLGDTVTLNGVLMVWNGTNSRFELARQQSLVGQWTYFVNSSSETTYGISAFNQNSQEISVIWDQIIVRSYSIEDSRIDVDTLIVINVTLEYAYDDSDVVNGLVLIQSVSATHVENGIWQISMIKSSVQSVKFDTVVCSGNVYEISSVNQNAQQLIVIWDQITVRGYEVSDPRDNVGDTIIVTVELEYEFDDSDVIDGTVTINSISFTYTGSLGKWSASRMQSSVTSETYDTVSISGNTHGITDINQNGQSQVIIWDRIQVLTTSVDDGRIDIDTPCEIRVTLMLEYDSTPLGLGDTVTLNGVLMVWNGTNSRFELARQQSLVGQWTYFVNSTSETTYGISALNLNSQEISVIWDELSITITPDATDVNDFDTVTFTLVVTFSYDSSLCTTYTVDISRNGTYWLSFTNSNASQFEDTNVALTYNYSTLAVTGESTFGITVFTTNIESVTWSTPTNFAPFNNGAPILENPDDSDNMYSKLRFYFITSSIMDYDTYADVDYVELSLWHNSGAYEVWRVRFTSATQSFSIEFGSEYIQLSASSSFIEIGYQLNITWHIKIDWDHFDMSNVALNQSVIDISAVSDTDWYESDWDVETHLDYWIAPSLSDDWGDVDTVDLQASGRIIYFGSGSLLSPLANETDVWVIHDFSGSWSANVTALGEFSISGIGSSSLVRDNIYTFKIVEAGLSYTSADLFHSTSPTDRFITDIIEFYESGVADSRININSPCDVWWRVKSQYNESDIQSGLTAYLNGIHLLTWDSANSRWHFQEVRSSAVNRSYTISSALETTVGISSWVQIAADQSVVWDSLIISITDPFDQRTNVNTNATGIRVSAIYSYDSTPFDGTILLSNNTFQFSTVYRQYYTATSAFGDSYGITVIVVNDQTWCIWDQIEVVSIITNMTYLDPSEYVRVQIELRFDFDYAPVTSGNFSLKFEELVHLADGIWEVNVTRLTYSTVNFDTLTICEATAFGITSFDMYGNEQVVYWDRLEFFVAYTTDSRIDVGSTGFIIWAIKLQTAGINITSGVIAEVSDGSILTFVSDNWRSAHSSDLVEDITFTMVSASLEGIDFFVRSTSDVTIIWDRIKVVSTSATITNPEIERYIQIQATLVFEYDNSPVTSGVVTLWDQDSQMSMIYNATGGFWFANLTKVETGNYTFYISAVSGNLYGITVVELAGNLIIVEYVPTILPRLTMEMIITISSGFGIILLASAILIRKKYLVKVPYEIKQINRALKSMEKGEPVELLDVRSLDNLLLAVLEPGLVELGLSPVEIFGEETSDGEIEESWAPDSEAELLDIMDEFKIPDYKQELDEGELDVSILSESESEAAWAKMLEEVRRIESEEGRKIPLTKEDWIERIPSEIKSIFFEEELRELDISELEHLTQLTPTEVQEIVDSISANEEMYTLEPEASASVISSALCEKFDSKSGEELDETEMKERLIQFLPTFVREFFSTTWLDKLSCAEIQELVTIPEEDLKIVIQSLMDSRDAAAEAEKELEVVTEAEAEMEVEPELEIQTEAEPEVVVDESAVEHDDPRMTELVEKYGEEKANFLFTIPEALLEGIPEEQIKEMDMDTLVGLKQALEPEIIEDEVSEDTTEIEEISEPEAELKDDLMTELKIEREAEPKDPEAELKADLLAELKSELKPEPEDTEAELEIEAEDEPESDPEDEPKE